jgi:hypothetical protein
VAIADRLAPEQAPADAGKIDLVVCYKVDRLSRSLLDFATVSGLVQFLWFLFQKELGERRWPFMLEFVLGHDPDLAQVKSALMPWLADEQSRTRTLPAKQSKR